MPTLDDMPEDVMSKIFEKLDFQSILTLRKVSHNLSNFIDDSKPDLDIEFIDIRIDSEKTSLTLQNYTSNTIAEIEYHQEGNGCIVKCGLRKISLKTESYSSRFCQDLKQILDFQNSFTSFKVYCKTVPEEFSNTLKLREKLLETQYFAMRTIGQDQVFEVLAAFNPKFIKEICIFPWVESGTIRVPWSIDKLVDLEHLKRAEALEVLVEINSPVENFLHFSIGRFMVTNISTNDLLILKEAFLKSSVFKYYHMLYSVVADVENIPNLFGPPFFENELLKTDKGRWYFKIPDSDDVIEFVFHLYDYFQFTRKKLSNIPSNAFLQD